MTLDTFIVSLLNTLLFAVFVTLFWFIPGLFLTPKSKLKQLDKIFLSLSVGFASFAFVVFITRLLQLPFWISYIPFLGITAWGFKAKMIKSKPLPKLNLQHKLLVLIIIIGAIIQGQVLIGSAQRTSEGLRFLEISAHDSFQHIYLINELKENFPPRHPGFSGVNVKNYHFLIDLTLASISKYIPFSTFELYYRVLPIAVSIFLSIGVFTFTRRLTKSEFYANIGVFLVIFSGNAAWFIKFFRGPEFEGNANAFMLDPIIDLMQNPMAVLVFPLMLAGIWGLSFIERKSNFRWTIFTAVVLGVIIGFKAWGGTLMIISLGAVAIWMTIFKKRFDGWILLGLTLAMSLTLFLPVYDKQTAANPEFVPGWLLKQMVQDKDRVNLLNHFFLEQHYRATNNILQLVILNLKQFSIYFFGNLWVRLLGIIYIIKLLKKPKTSTIFIITLILASFLLPVLFNQGRMAYDIIQFGPYSLVLISIATAVAAKELSHRLPKKIFIIGLTILMISSVPSNFKSIKTRFTGDKFLVSNQELEGYKFLNEQTDLESAIMVYASVRNDAILQVAALSGRPTYFSGKSFTKITGDDEEYRKEEWESFFINVGFERRMKAINEGSIDYIFLKKQEDKEFKASGLNLEKVFSNEETTVYKIL